MRILLTGASGFAGSLLLPRLLADGHHVRALARDPQRVTLALERQSPHLLGVGNADADADAQRQRLQILQGDVLTGEGLREAFRGTSVAYYLIHSMEAPNPESDPDGTFAQREAIAAENFAREAQRAGVERIVYLGGLLPAPAPGEDPPRNISRHLASRAAVEELLREAVPETVALRASIVIGARSRSFRFLVRLVERLPVLTLPAWRNFRTQPIDSRDVTQMLLSAACAPVAGRSLDIGGPDILTYGELISGIADEMLVNRPTLGLRVNLTPMTARFAAAIAGEDPELIVPLMEGLHGDLLPRDDHADELLSVKLHSFDSAVSHALGEWEKSEPLAAR